MLTTVYVYNQSVALETSDSRLIDVIKAFIKDYYTKTETVYGQQQKSVVEKCFVGKIDKRPIWYFHVNQFAHLYSHLKALHVNTKEFETVDCRFNDAETTDYRVREGWVLRPDQEPPFEFVTSNPKGSRLLPLVTGSGKAQPLTSLIKIPGGWDFMGNMKVGTEVIAKDGTTTKVTGVFPQGKTPCYEITFRDGRVAKASGDHLWRVFNAAGRMEKWSVITTTELKALVEKPQPRAYIELCDSEVSQDKDLPIHPYVLGVLLGDGGLSSGQVRFTKHDPEIAARMEDLLPNDVTINYRGDGTYSVVNRVRSGSTQNPVKEALDVLGLIGKRSYEKFVPEEYLLGSHEQRLELLRGLLDTDGTVCLHGTVSFCTSSYNLAKHVQYLVRSMGGTARISKKYPHYTYKGQRLKGRDAYQVNIRYKRPSELFTLERKKNRTNDNNQYAEVLKLKVDKVEYIGEMETQCISIEHPDRLYITNDFVVTHNTAVALFALAHLRKRAGVVILPTFMDKWVEDIVTIHDADKKDIAVVSGYKAIATLVANAREDHIDHDYFIFSAKTLQEFIKNYEADPDECVELYGCAPTDLFPLLGIGVMLVDETHMAFHSLYKTTVYMNVDYQIGLSATLIAEDPVTARVHRVMYPSRCIYGDTMLKQYLDIYALGYNLSPHFAGKIKTANYGSSTYSHTAFEKSIMKHREIRKGYFELIKATIEDFYDRDYIAGDKLMVFVATVAMATELTAYLANCYPDKQCVRYCEEDSYEDMLKGEIIVTTVISAGTGLDVPNLRVGIQTVSVSSAVSNIQTAGRLRKLPDRDVKFIYLYCINIPKQRQYHTKRKEIFAGRVANYHCLMASKGLR